MHLDLPSALGLTNRLSAHFASFATTIGIPALNAVAMMSASGVDDPDGSGASSKGAHERLGHAHHADRRAVASGPHEVVDDHGRGWAGRLAGVQIREDGRGVEEDLGVGRDSRLKRRAAHASLPGVPLGLQEDAGIGTPKPPKRARVARAYAP